MNGTYVIIIRKCPYHYFKGILWAFHYLEKKSLLYPLLNYLGVLQIFPK